MVFHVVSIYGSLEDQLVDQALEGAQQEEGRFIYKRSRSYSVAVLSLGDSLYCAPIVYVLGPSSMFRWTDPSRQQRVKVLLSFHLRIRRR